MRAIMQLALEGKKNAEIAERLNVSPETVHTLKKVAYKSFVHSLPIIIIAFCYLSKSTFFSIFSKKSLYRFTMFSFWLVLSLKID